MNALCDTCKYHWWDASARDDVAKLFAAARKRLKAEGRVLSELNGLEADCMELSEHHLCLGYGMEPVLDEGEDECRLWKEA